MCPEAALREAGTKRSSTERTSADSDTTDTPEKRPRHDVQVSRGGMLRDLGPVVRRVVSLRSVEESSLWRRRPRPE